MHKLKFVNKEYLINEKILIPKFKIFLNINNFCFKKIKSWFKSIKCIKFDHI